MSALPDTLTRTQRADTHFAGWGLSKLIREALAGAVLPWSEADPVTVMDVEKGRNFAGFAEVRCTVRGVPHIITIRSERDALEQESRP